MAFVPDDEVVIPEKKYATATLEEVKTVFDRRFSCPPSPAPCSMQPPPGVPRLDPKKARAWASSMQDAKMRQQLIRLLGKTLIFADTTEGFRQAVLQRLVPAEYAAGQVIFRDDEPGDWLAVVLSGELDRKLHRVGIEVSTGSVGPGGIIGDFGMFGINPNRSFTVSAATPTVLLVLTAADFEEAVLTAGGPRSLSLFRDCAEMQNLMADVESFLELPCFRKLGRDFVLTLRQNSEPRLCYPNQVLMREGHFGDEMFVLRSGSVKIERGGKFVVELPAGSVLGELAVLGSDPRRTATVTCLQLCLMRALHASVFHALLNAFPAAKRAFEHSFIARSASMAVESAKAEKKELDFFYGAAAPKKGSEIHAILGVEQSRVADIKRKALLDEKRSVLVLPKLAIQNGKVQTCSPRTRPAP